MSTVTYIDHLGLSRACEVPDGRSVMRGAVDNGVAGIVAECGGTCTCSTCHIYIDAPWNERIDAPESQELSMLNFVIDASPCSRLACQVIVTPSLDGLVVRMPVSQV